MKTEIRPVRMRTHHGRNIRRIREMVGMKPDVFAERLHISSADASRYEQEPAIDDEMLEKIAAALNVPVEAIKDYNEETSSYFINTFNDNSNNNNNFLNIQPTNCTFNPIDKIVSLYNEKMELYERLLKAEQEKVDMLQRAIEENKT